MRVTIHTELASSDSTCWLFTGRPYSRILRVGFVVDEVSKLGFLQTVRFSSSGYHSANNLYCPVNRSQLGGTELTVTLTYSQVRTWDQACFRTHVCLKVDVFTNLSTQPRLQPGPWSPVARQRGGISKTHW